jgi:hypothetical protein
MNLERCRASLFTVRGRLAIGNSTYAQFFVTQVSQGQCGSFWLALTHAQWDESARDAGWAPIELV